MIASNHESADTYSVFNGCNKMFIDVSDVFTCVCPEKISEIKF